MNLARSKKNTASKKVRKRMVRKQRELRNNQKNFPAEKGIYCEDGC
jgi:hypothetical protein